MLAADLALGDDEALICCFWDGGGEEVGGGDVLYNIRVAFFQQTNAV